MSYSGAWTRVVQWREREKSGFNSYNVNKMNRMQRLVEGEEGSRLTHVPFKVLMAHSDNVQDLAGCASLTFWEDV